MRIEKQAERQCFMAFGVCEGNHDFEGNTCPDSDEEGVEGDGGRSALASKTAWMLSTQRFFPSATLDHRTRSIYAVPNSRRWKSLAVSRVHHHLH
jgi:hypothetical protein